MRILIPTQISKINSTFIHEVKKYIFEKFSKTTQKENSEQSIFELNEILTKIEINQSYDLFADDEEEIIKFFISKHSIRNKKQLEYLSGLKQNKIDPIKFTLRPNFGFLFIIRSNDKLHYCWELLNSHATYLWSYPLNYIDSLEDVEKSINIIHSSGRQYYKKDFKNSQTNNEISFNLIRHQNDINGFVKWKDQFNKLTK